MPPEFTPQEIAECRLQKEIEASIRCDREVYQERSQAAPKPIPAPPLSNYEQAKRDARGSRRGVPRGSYKKRGEMPRKLTKLATSKHYSQQDGH